VTAVEAHDARDIRQLHFREMLYHCDRAEWLRICDDSLFQLKNGFWYAWHRLDSSVEVVYAPIASFPLWRRRFDVVIAGAIVEHLADPVSAICNMALLAEETLIVAFTPVEDTDEQVMRTANQWDDPEYCYTWWTMSRGLYERILGNVGFSVEFVTATAVTQAGEQRVVAERPTIIARRL